MNRFQPMIVALVLLGSPVVWSAPARADGSWDWPLRDRHVSRAFVAPESSYGPGHRGIDLPGAVGDAVRAVAAGRVAFAGTVAGVRIVTITHGAERSTYQPVHAVVQIGDAVAQGQRIGRLEGSPSHCGSPCLHLGRLRAKEYLDPQDRLRSTHRVRLVNPDGPPPRPPSWGSGTLSRPVGGPVTSAFGMRVHPITGIRKLHDGADFGAPCGTPIRAAAGGVVTSIRSEGGYGQRLMIDHGAGRSTGYAHLSAFRARAGQRVSAGDVVGLVGRTGYATGCHLHFMVTEHGRPVDPLPQV